MYKSVFMAANEPNRKFDIIYRVTEENDSFYIESFIGGGKEYEKCSLGNCGLEKAEKLALLFAKNSVRPMHIEDIISDMHF